MCKWKIKIKSKFASVFVLIYFLEKFKIHSKIKGKVQWFPIYPQPHTCIASLIINILNQSGTFVTTDELTLAHYIIQIHSLHYGSLLVVWKMYNNVYPSLWYRTDIVFSLSPEFAVLCLFIPLPDPTPGKHWSFYCLHSCLFQSVIYLESYNT